MIVLTAEAMREMDRRAMVEGGIPGAVLMENAGRAVRDVICRRYGPLIGKRIAVYCGAGANGGDGFVLARLLQLEGAQVQVVYAAEKPPTHPDAALFHNIICAMGIPIRGVQDPLFDSRDADLVVDALLGTGSRGAPTGLVEAAVRRIVAGNAAVVSVDLPTGVNSDTGAVEGVAVQANDTVTFAAMKRGLFLFPGARQVGQLHVAPIGWDWSALCPPNSPETFEAAAARTSIPTAHADANKGDFGHVAVIAGSLGMSGAPALTARAAQRAGAGLVTVLVPRSIQPVLAVKLDEQMTVALPETDGALSSAAFDDIAHFAHRATVLAVGPGITVTERTVALVARIVAELAKPLVLDADGLNALALEPAAAHQRPLSASAPLILTPHPGEAARLLNCTIAEVEADRYAAVAQIAETYRATVVLKGRYTLTCAIGGKIYVNTNGNRGMATGGAGDTLTGILAAMAAREFASTRHGERTTDANDGAARLAAAGVYAHGRAGDIAARQRGHDGLTASDIIAAVPQALNEICGGH